jgi:TolA-binding protein
MQEIAAYNAAQQLADAGKFAAAAQAFDNFLKTYPASTFHWRPT